MVSAMDDKANTLAENVYLRLTARISIIFASLIGVPLALWVVSTAYTKIEAQGVEVIALRTQVGLLQQRQEFVATQQAEASKVSAATLAALKETLQAATTDLYRGRDAERDSRMTDEKLKRLEQRLDALEFQRRGK